MTENIKDVQKKINILKEMEKEELEKANIIVNSIATNKNPTESKEKYDFHKDRELALHRAVNLLEYISNICS